MKRSIIRNVLYGLLALVLVVFMGCGSGTPQNTASPDAESNTNPAEEQVDLPTIRIKNGEGEDAFSLRTTANGVRLLDGTDKEIARFTPNGSRKFEIANAENEVIGYVRATDRGWKMEGPDTTTLLYDLRQQANGNFRLVDGSDAVVYQIRMRDNGLVIRTPDKQTPYKVKSQEDRLSLRDANNEVVLRTTAGIPPLALACFGFEKLGREQQAALAYIVAVSPVSQS